MMSGSFWELFQTDPSQAIVTVLLVFVIYVLLGLLPVCGILYLI